jgi:hypothetical protein
MAATRGTLQAFWGKKIQNVKTEAPINDSSRDPCPVDGKNNSSNPMGASVGGEADRPPSTEEFKRIRSPNGSKENAPNNEQACCQLHVSFVNNTLPKRPFFTLRISYFDISLKPMQLKFIGCM